MRNEHEDYESAEYEQLRAVHAMFRRFSRLVYTTPTSSYYHKKRINAALNFDQAEPLQGALADYFFACWYEMAQDGDMLLNVVKDKLPAHLADSFRQYIRTGRHVGSISTLATRWSVLVTPSMEVHNHRISKDDAIAVAKNTSTALLAARLDKDELALAQLEHEYFAHCMACQDRMGFMVAWFALAKENWHFHEGWLACRDQLEKGLQ